MVDVNVGKRIRSIRRRLHLTQAQFAKGLGVIGVSVARYESGRVPRADVLDRIARAGGTTSSWLLHGQESETATSKTDTPKISAPQRIRELIMLLEPDWKLRPWSEMPSEHRTRYKRR